MQPINQQSLIGQKVIYRGYNFAVEATILAITQTRFGTTDVLLDTGAGFPMWRSFGACTVIQPAAPLLAVNVLDEVEVTEPNGEVYYGTVVNILNDIITVRTEEDEFIKCQSAEITRITPAQPQPKLSKPVVVSRLVVGDVIALPHQRLEILSLTADYQRNTIAAFKTATVRDVATGEQSEIRLFGNMRYSRMEMQP